VPPDSLQRAIAEVFARPEYRWVTGRSPLQWLAELVGRLLDWLRRTQEGHPAAFKLLLVGLVVALVALLAHMAYVVWRITRPTVRTAAGRGAVANSVAGRGGQLACRNRLESGPGNVLLRQMLRPADTGSRVATARLRGAEA